MKIDAARCAAIVAVLLVQPGIACAQTVDELYASNCKSAAQKASEGCKALAKSRAQRVQAQPAVAIDAKKWGALADVAGGIWHSPGQLVSYRWIEPNRVLEETQLLTQDVRTFTARPDGTIEMAVKPSQLNTQYAPYTAVMTVDAAGDYEGKAHVRYTFDDDSETTFKIGRRGDKLSFRQLFLGTGTPWQTIERATDEEIAAARGFYETAAQPDQIRKNWGLLSQMVGGTWEHKSFGDRDMKSYRWLTPGVAMVQTSATVGNDAAFVAKPYQTVVGFDPISGITTLGTRGTDEGGMVAPERNDIRSEYEWIDDAHYREIAFQKKKGSWKKLLTNNYYRLRGTDVPTQFAAVLGDETDKGLGLGGKFGDIVSGAIMGAASGYAQGGGSSAGAMLGAMGGAVVGKAGGNDALYQQMQTASAQATADAQASQRQLQRTIAQAQRGGSTAAPPVGAAASSTPTSRAAPAAGARSEAGAARSGTAPMTRDAYLYANMPLRDLAGANPKCVSNVFQLRFSADTKEWGDVDAKARAAAAAQFPAFVAKCNSGGKGTVQGEPKWVIADGPGGEPIRAPHVNPVDTVVRMP